MLPQKFSNFSFLTLEFKNRPLATIFCWLESEDQEIKLVWPHSELLMFFEARAGLLKLTTILNLLMFQCAFNKTLFRY